MKLFFKSKKQNVIKDAELIALEQALEEAKKELENIQRELEKLRATEKS